MVFGGHASAWGIRQGIDVSPVAMLSSVLREEVVLLHLNLSVFAKCSDLKQFDSLLLVETLPWPHLRSSSCTHACRDGARVLPNWRALRCSDVVLHCDRLPLQYLGQSRIN